jgi:hypothetical protein
MARLWSCGFELQSATALMEWDTNAGTGAPAISTTTFRSGLAALRINPTTQQRYIEHQLDASGTVKRTFHRFYLNIATAPSATTAIYAIGQSGFFPCYIRLTTARKLELYDGNTAAVVQTGATTLATGTWYRVEVDHNDGASGTGTVTIYLDGVSEATGACSVINGFSRVRMGVYNFNATADLFFDDWAVNDTSGSAQTGLPGAGSIVHLYPDSAGDGNTWQTSAGGAGSATNVQAVDEVTPDDGTTYLKRIATTIKVDDYNLESSASKGIGSGDTVTLVAVGVRGGAISATASTDRDILLRIKSQASGTVVKSASSTNRMNINGWTTHAAAVVRNHKLVSYTDPQAGGAWTPAKLDTAQIGMENQTSVITEVRVSAIWALVEYVPATTISHNLGLITVTETPQALTRLKNRAIGLASAAETAQAMTRRKSRSIGLVASSETAQALSRYKSRGLGLATETCAVQANSHYKARPLGLIASTEAAQAFSRIKYRSIGLNTETDAAQVLRPSKVKLLGLITSTDVAQAMSRIKLRQLNLVTESEAAQGISRVKLRSIALVLSTEAAQAMTHYKMRPLGLVTETDAAQALARLKLHALGLVTETDAAQIVTWHKQIRLGLITELEVPRSITSFVVLFKDITVTVEPARLRTAAEPDGASRIFWGIDEPRTFWAVVDTVLREHASLDEARSAAEAEPGNARTSTDIGPSRLGYDIEPARNDREE